MINNEQIKAIWDEFGWNFYDMAEEIINLRSSEQSLIDKVEDLESQIQNHVCKTE